MEYNQVQHIPIPVLRNRLVLLHHFSDLFCPSIAMFDLEHSMAERDAGAGHADGVGGLDLLRGVLVSAAKVSLQWSSVSSQKLRSRDSRDADIQRSGKKGNRSTELHCVWFIVAEQHFSSLQETAFRKVVQATMIRDRQHGPVIEINRIQVKLH